MNSPLIEKNDILTAARIVRAVNHKMRQKIIHLLDEEKKMTVTELQILLQVEQSVVSQQLGILRREGIVEKEQDGKFRYYSIVHTRLREINEYAKLLSKGK